LKASELLSHHTHYSAQARSYLQAGDFDTLLQHMNHRGFLLGTNTESTGTETIVQVAGEGGSHLHVANYRDTLWGQQGKQPAARSRVTRGAASRGADPFGTTSPG